MVCTEHTGQDKTPMQASTGVMTTNARQAFGELLERHRKIVFKVANTYSRHPDDRADLAQEIAAQLWRAFPGYDPARSFSTWMYRIALNVAISFVRSHQHRDERTEPLDESHAEIAGHTGVAHELDERVRALEQFIAQLEPLNRALLLLYLEEHSYREIADILGISETNVATKISRLKQRIRQDMATIAAN
jgi:RNA polymerase sigma-70 factor (ECF subfamily)